MMWTVAPLETWMEQTETNTASDEIVCHNGIWMSVMRDDAGGYRIKRVLSTDPNDYLRADIVPGAMVR